MFRCTDSGGDAQDLVVCWVLEVDVSMPYGWSWLAWDVSDKGVGLRHIELDEVRNNENILLNVVLDPNWGHFNDEVQSSGGGSRRD